MGQALDTAEGSRRAEGRPARPGAARRRDPLRQRLYGAWAAWGQRLWAWRKKPTVAAWLWGGGTLVTAFAAGATVLPGQVAPFGLAMVIAVPQQGVLVSTAGCVLGSFVALPPPLALRQAAGALVTCALRLLLGRGGSLLAGAAGVAACSLLSQAVFSLGSPQAGPAGWVVQGLLVLGLGMLYRSLRRDTFLGDTPRRQLVLLAVWTSVAAALACCGLLGLPWLQVAAGLLTLVLTLLDQEDRLPLAWVGAALACLAAKQSAAALLPVLCAGWCAGHFAATGSRAGTAGAYFACGLLVVFVAPDLAAVLRLVGANAVCALLFWALPQRLFHTLEAAIAAGEARRARTPAQTLTALAGGLEAVAGALEAVGRVSAPVRQDPDAPLETACAQVCGACTQKAACWGAHYGETMDLLRQFLGRWRSDCTAEFPPYFHCVRPAALRTALLRAENLRVLRAAGQLENGVLRRAVSDQYRALAQGLDGLARGWQPAAAQPQLENRLLALCATLQLPARRVCAERLPDGAPKVRLTLHGTRLGSGGLEGLAEEVGRCCGRPMVASRLQSEETRDLELCFLPRPAYMARIGVASRALAGGVCGDVAEQLEQDGVQYLLLCDGMGTGRTAALDAKMAALFTARLLRAGFDCQVAARLANAALLTRAPGDRGSTLDALRFFGLTGEASLYKAGACASFVCSGGKVRRLGGETGGPGLGLPLGSAETLRDATLTLTLRPGDWLVMATDGALAAGSARLERALAALGAAGPETDPEQAAQQLLTACLAGAPPQDDCTVVAVQILPYRPPA